MKRANPGGGGGSAPAKRPATSGAGGAVAKDGQGLTTTDALSYLREVKNRFSHQREIYDQFLDVMKEFKAQSIDTNGVIAKVQSLFKGHPELVLGFNMFLPAGYKIESATGGVVVTTTGAAAGARGASGGPQRPVPSQARSKPAMTKEQQLARRRERDAANREAAAQARKKAAEEKKEAKNKAPAAAAAAADKAKQPVEFDQAINYVNKIKKRFAGDDRVYKAFLEILNQYRKGQQSIGQVYERVSILFAEQEDLLNEFTYFLPDTTQKAPQPPAGKPRPATGPRSRPAGNRPPAGPPGRPIPVQRQEVDDEPAGGRPGTRQATRRGRTASEEGTGGRGNTLGAGGGRGGQSAPKMCIAKEFAFFDRLKLRLRNKDAYGDLMKVLSMFSSSLITKAEMEMLTGFILASHPEMQQGFLNFVDICSTIDPVYEEGKEAKRDENLSPKEKELLAKISRRSKYYVTPISDLDLNKEQHCSTSYRHLPEDYPKLDARGRTPLQASVLNDHWVSVITGSEDYSFKHMRKNQYEDALFRCEDDRFELDMIMQSNLSAIRAIEAVLERFEGLEPDEWSIRPRDLRQVQRRAIIRLYGDNGEQVLDLIETRPAVALPTVHTRLKQKHEEFVKIKADMEPHWEKQYEANYINSLDHRSFYFKQSDKKNLSVKALIAEMQELAEKRSSTEPYLATLAPGTASHLQLSEMPSDLEMAYEEEIIHDDCYRMIVNAVREYLGPMAQGRVLDFWCRFIEPLLGLPERACSEKTEKEPACEALGEIQTGTSNPNSGSERGRDITEGEPEPKRSGSEASSGASMDGGKDDIDEVAQDVKKVGSEDEEDEGAQAARNLSFKSCRPLMTTSVGLEAIRGPPGKPPGVEEIFYCHDSLFLALKLHELLYERLQIARRCCHTKKKRFNPHGHSVEKTKDQLKREKRQAAEDHEQFMQSVQLLLKTKIDSSAFEDEMRPLLGANAYVTFTLDKLLHKLVKQLQALAQDPIMHRLQALQTYEASRASPGGGSLDWRLKEAMYRADAQMLLQDEPCFRVVRISSSPAIKIGLSLVNSQPVQTMEGPSSAPPLDFQKYIGSWMDKEYGPEERPAGFLARGLSSADAKDTASPDSMMDSCSMFNGLEVKVSCVTSKVSYVLGTEDLFLRRGKSPLSADSKSRLAEARAQKFQAWINNTREKIAITAERTAKSLPESAQAVAAAAPGGDGDEAGDQQQELAEPDSAMDFYHKTSAEGSMERSSDNQEADVDGYSGRADEMETDDQADPVANGGDSHDGHRTE